MSRKQLFNGLAWTVFEKFSVQIIQFVISVILARLLSPKDYGLIGMVVIVTAVANVLVLSGLTTSLVRSLKVETIDYNTVFWYNLGMSVFLTVIIFWGASSIAVFYDTPELSLLIKVLAFNLVVGAMGAVQIAILSKEMNFKKLSLAQVPGTLVGGIAAVVCAYLGCGVWSLVVYSMATSIIKTSILFYLSRWRPSLSFSRVSFKNHFSYGLPLMGSNLLNTVFREGNKLFVGKVFMAADLGHYVRAETFRDLPINNISTTLSVVLFPYLAKQQDDKVVLIGTYRKLMALIVFLLSPILLYSSLYANEIFLLIFGPKWDLAAELFMFLSIAGVFYPLIAQNNNLVAVLGRSDIVFKSEVFKKILLIISLMIGYLYGLKALALSQIGVNVISWGISAYYSGKVAGFGLIKQFREYWPYLALGFLLYVLMMEWKSSLYFTSSLLPTIIITGTIFLVAYFSLSFLFRLEAAKSVWNILNTDRRA